MKTLILRNACLLAAVLVALGCSAGGGGGSTRDARTSIDAITGFEDDNEAFDTGHDVNPVFDTGPDVSQGDDTGPGEDLGPESDGMTVADGGLDATLSDVPASDALSDDAGSCTGGASNCSGTCVSLNTSSANCGGCGNICPVGTTCTGGACACTAGQTLCAGTCHNTATDTANCGGCAMPCSAGQMCAASVCVASTVMCGAGQTNCSGTCESLTTDPANCGGCGTVCAAGLSCTVGTCACASGTACTAADGTRSCVDLTSSNANCGACGMACGPGQTCSGSMCTCPTGQTNCGGTCRTTATDSANCGRCGVVCASGQMCVAGACTTTPVTCPTGQTNCGGTCETTATDPANCGGCGTACTTGQVCAGGACGCPAGDSACAGACVATTSFQTDNNNCGGCGTICHGGTACAAGVCTCPSGQTNCGGTCTPTATDSSNCGACGVACPTGTACAASHCACSASGQTLCGTTCRSTLTDPTNCGGCGVVCPAAQMCAAGACSCPSGQLACGSGSTIACVSAQSDPANCGSCGNACATGQTCTSGACIFAPPSNNTRAGAIVLDTTVPSVTTTGTLVGAVGNTTPAASCSPLCDTTGGNVFYTFTLSDAEIVYADTFGSATDTVLFLQNSAGTNITSAGTTGGTSCNDDFVGTCTGTGVSTTDSRITARVAAGTYYLVVKSCFAATMSTFNLRFQHIPVGNGTAVQITPSSTGASVTGTTSGTGNLTPPTGCPNGTGTASSPDNTVWWTSCPNDPITLFQATTCGTGTDFDSMVYEQNADNATLTCNDDQGFACGLASSVTAEIPAGAALHAVAIDGYNGAAGTYALSYREISCVTGFTDCSGTCLQTSRFTTDNNNCGGCGIVCSAGLTCTNSVCQPPNDVCSGAIPIALSGPGSITTVTGSLAGAVASTGTPTPRPTPGVWYSFTLTDRELISIDTFGTTSFDTVVGVDTSCSATSLLASDDDSACGTVCGADVGCDYHNSQLVRVLSAGTYYVVVNTYNVATGPFTLRIQRMQGISAAAGAIANTVPQGTYSFTADTAGAPTRVQACSGVATTTASPELTYVWTTCPAFTGGTFTATTCPSGDYDTLIQYRNSYNTGAAYNACDDDDLTCSAFELLSTISATEPAGAGMHVLTVSGWSGASGTTGVTGHRP